MTDSIMQNYNQLREQVINGDRRFQHKDGHLCFEGVDLDALARQYPTPFYVFSEPEIIRNIHEIQQAFAAHKNTKTFFASKTCSVMGVLKAIRDAGICAEANSQYEVRKCLEIGFRGDQIVFNGVVKSLPIWNMLSPTICILLMLIACMSWNILMPSLAS